MLCEHALKMEIAESSASKDLKNNVQLMSVLDCSLNHMQLAEVRRTLCLFPFEFSTDSHLQEEFVGWFYGSWIF